MKVDVKNELEQDGELYKAFSNITPEKFAEFYIKIFKDEHLNESTKINIRIGDNSFFGRPNIFCSFFPLNSLMPICFDLYGSSRLNNKCKTEKECTALWREFLTENLGEFYRALLAKHLKNSIDIEICEKNREYQGLVAKLAQIEREKAVLQEINKKLDQEYADVLNGETSKKDQPTEESVEINEETAKQTAQTAKQTAKQTESPVETTK